MTSPWIAQLPKRPLRQLTKPVTTDVVVIGAGIAGVTTAYYLLRYTKHRVVVLDAFAVGHGASGRNAGQIVSYFERPFTELAKRFGKKAAVNAQRDVLNAWNLLDDLAQHVTHKPVSFKGAAACVTVEQALLHAKNIAALSSAGIAAEEICVDKKYLHHFLQYKFVIPVSTKELRQIVRSKGRYAAALRGKKGVVNSALLCYELVEYLQDKYADRFSLYENSPVARVTFGKHLTVHATKRIHAKK